MEPLDAESVEALFDDGWVEPHAGSSPGAKSDGAKVFGVLVDPLSPDAEVLRHLERGQEPSFDGRRFRV
jgi:hypothetical protein